MCLQGASTRKVEQITGKLSGVKISKDAVSRTTQRLDALLKDWRAHRLDRAYPYLYPDCDLSEGRLGRCRSGRGAASGRRRQ